MIFFKKKHKFYPCLSGCTEPLALKVFLNEKGNLEKDTKDFLKEFFWSFYTHHQ